MEHLTVCTHQTLFNDSYTAGAQYVGKTSKTGFGNYWSKTFSFKIPFITVGLDWPKFMVAPLTASKNEAWQQQSSMKSEVSFFNAAV